MCDVFPPISLRNSGSFPQCSVPSSRPIVQIPKAQQKEKRSCVGDLQFLVGSKYGKR